MGDDEGLPQFWQQAQEEMRWRYEHDPEFRAEYEAWLDSIAAPYPSNENEQE